MFPKRFKVIHTPCVGAGEDGMGNDVPLFGDPVPRKVYGWSTHNAEKLGESTSRDVAEIDLAMPPARVGLQDRFDLLDPDDPDTRPYEVVEVRDRTKGFHGWRPGIVVELKRVTG
jgi:hypothetical protein